MQVRAISGILTIRGILMAKSTTQRVAEQRSRRLKEGWVEVRVWVTSEEEAASIRKLAADYRAANRDRSMQDDYTK